MRGWSQSRRRLIRTRSSVFAALVLAIAIAIVGTGAATSATTGPVTVVLEFDNGSISQFTLGYQQALSPHNAKATFFVQSGSLGNSPTATQMSWSQLQDDRLRRERHRRQVHQRDQPDHRSEPDHPGLWRPDDHPVARAEPGRFRLPRRRQQRDRAGHRPGLRLRQRADRGRSRHHGRRDSPAGNWLATKAYAPGAVTNANLQTIVNNAQPEAAAWSRS